MRKKYPMERKSLKLKSKKRSLLKTKVSFDFRQNVSVGEHSSPSEEAQSPNIMGLAVLWVPEIDR